MGQPQIGTHLASLNLFLEADGSLHITCAGTSEAFKAEFPKWAADNPGRPPIDLVDQMVLQSQEPKVRQSIVDSISRLVARRDEQKLPQQITEAVKCVAVKIAKGEL